MDFLANNPLNDPSEMGECDECSAPYSLASASDHDPETGLCAECAARKDGGYCCDYYWVPFCDSCGDDGCPDCDDGETPNHDCERWDRMERERLRLVVPIA